MSLLGMALTASPPSSPQRYRTAWVIFLQTFLQNGRCKSRSYSSVVLDPDFGLSIFLFVGLVTIVSAPIAYWRLDSDIPSARFLTEHEKAQAIERLRANQTGTGSREFNWSHVLEAVMEPKNWLFIGMSLLNNLGAAVTNTFGPLILAGLGYDKYTTSLLNMPFGAVQFIIIMLASWAAQKAKWKSAVLATIMLPVIAGLVMLYLLKRSEWFRPCFMGL